MIEKLAFTLMLAQRLRPYFQAHTIRVLTKYPLKKVMQKPDILGRLVNWAIELGEFDIEFYPRTTIKGQALADFHVEFCNFLEPGQLPKGETWIVYVDGSSTRKWGRAGIMLTNPEGSNLEFSIRLDFPTTNNEAEYEAIIAGMSLAQDMGAKNLEVRSDSQVEVTHIQGEYEARGVKMKKYLTKLQELQILFNVVVLTRIPRKDNSRADFLAKLGSTVEEEAEASEQKIQVLTEPSILLTIKGFTN
jgi:ribonuclease HI